MHGEVWAAGWGHQNEDCWKETAPSTLPASVMTSQFGSGGNAVDFKHYRHALVRAKTGKHCSCMLPLQLLPPQLLPNYGLTGNQWRVKQGWILALFISVLLYIAFSFICLHHSFCPFPITLTFFRFFYFCFFFLFHSSPLLSLSPIYHYFSTSFTLFTSLGSPFLLRLSVFYFFDRRNM